jgi:hypothetical protein
MSATEVIVRRGRKSLALAVVLSGMFLTVLDAVIVNVARCTRPATPAPDGCRTKYHGARPPCPKLRRSKPAGHRAAACAVPLVADPDHAQRGS